MRKKQSHLDYDLINGLFWSRLALLPGSICTKIPTLDRDNHTVITTQITRESHSSHERDAI